MTEFVGFMDRIQGALDKAKGVATQANTKAAQEAAPAPSFLKAITEATNIKNRAEVESSLIPVYKSLGSIDIAALRLVSISDRTTVKRNEETKFLNWLESKEQFPPILDYQYRIKERDILTDVASVFNVDASLPPALQSAYLQRYNTLTAVGNTLKVSFMASSIAEQQSDVNLLEEQIDDEIVRIRRTMNSLLLNNTELTSESPANVPQLGGFITRSTVTTSAGGGNFTNSLIQSQVNTIGSIFGFDKQLLMWSPVSQIPAIDDLMIARYPGNNAMSHFERIEMALRDVLRQYRIPVSAAYVPRPGLTVPVVHDTQLPTGTAIIFIGDFPRMPKFKMDGRVGPFVLARPEPTLYELVLVFDLFTLEDPQLSSRIVITNLA